MKNLNTIAQFLLLITIFIFIAGFFIVENWKSYLVGSLIMYVMCSIVLNKYKEEIKELR